MSSSDWTNTGESDAAEEIINELQSRGVIDENKEYIKEEDEEDLEQEALESKVDNSGGESKS